MLPAWTAEEHSPRYLAARAALLERLACRLQIRREAQAGLLPRPTCLGEEIVFRQIDRYDCALIKVARMRAAVEATIAGLAES